MLTKSRIIVLHTIKHSDSGMVVQCYSDVKGRSACYYFAGGKHSKSAMMFPLSMLDVVLFSRHQEGNKMPVIKEAVPVCQLPNLKTDIRKGAISIFIKEPENFPVKFNWKVTVNVDGSSTSTPMRLDHGQYEAKAMTFAGEIAAKLPGKSEAAAKNMIKDVLAYCGDDFELKDVVSRTIRGLCITATATMRTHDEIKARIDAIRANLEEVRKAAAGNNRIEKAGFNLLWGMNGKSVPPGLIGKMLKAASAEKPARAKDKK